MKVLIAASEVAPIVKLGGLGDVIGSLPKALEKIGVEADVIVPYFSVAKTDKLNIQKVMELEVPFDNNSILVEVHKTKLPNSNVDVFLLRNAKYFALGGKDAFANTVAETEMFAFFNRSIVEFVKAKFNIYDLVHCNDWHTGFVTHLLSDEIGRTRPATLLTVHNLSYQGVSNLELLQDLGVDPGAHPLIEWDITDDDINMMQQGVSSSDFISTVSPTYAKEILTEELGGELSSVLQARSGRLVGIINGIDYSQFPRDYSLKDWKSKKKLAKASLQKELGLKVDENVPVLSFISRLDPNQKGLDILFESFDFLKDSGVQFILLGTGDPGWENKFKDYGQNKEVSEQFSINIEFNVSLANKIYAGSNFFYVPSRFEPCGLTQMISMWYGTLPIVHSTGGLKDSVKEGHNGFAFTSYSAQDLQKATTRALEVYLNKKHYEEMVKNAMESDFSWDNSAKEYKKLYTHVMDIRKISLNMSDPISTILE